VIPRHLILAVGAMLVLVLLMSIYVRHIRKSVAEIQAAAADTRPVSPPVAGPSEQITLYVAYDDPGMLHAQTARISLPAGRQQRSEEVLRTLVNLYLDKSSPHRLAPGSEIRDVYLVDPGLAVVDTNAAFADGHRSGILVEELTVASLVESLAANVAGIDRVRFLVDGKRRDTLAGHADLADSYDVSAVRTMAAQMQSGQ
jgi:Sporulation and spore germination